MSEEDLEWIQRESCFFVGGISGKSNGIKEAMSISPGVPCSDPPAAAAATLRAVAHGMSIRRLRPVLAALGVENAVGLCKQQAVAAYVSESLRHLSL